MKKLFFLPLAIFALVVFNAEKAVAATTAATAQPVTANTTSNLKIAVIDFRRIMQQSPQAKTVTEKLKKEFMPREEKIRKAQQELEKKEVKLKRDASVLTQSEQRDLEAEILGARRELQRLEEDYQQDITLAQDQALQDLLGKINKAISKVAEKGNFDLILEKNKIPYVVAKLDVTNDVLQELK